MARDRFSDLERVYDALKVAKVDIDSLPQKLDFVKYGQWKEGNGPAFSVTMPDLNGEKEVGIIAFGLVATNAAAKKLVTMSGRSHTFWTGLAQKAKFGVEETVTDYFKDGSFVSAKAHVGVKATGVEKTSHITGRKYKKTVNAAYTIPVGQTASDKYFQELVNSLLEETTLQQYVISISPEQFRRD
ncbi:hypothetical protein C7H19_19815 [Aphanothece hegewaldii CCALA 016]|uniref:Uncharacterized protein n=1 Tax=Aphanothece hegewaldii CCALA 016 TaxID=2107694 RepID=A0A2T1LT85_9CHRO|nr:hypothetical protein [Aphanothece hegewaldii]PSF33635.1 hypothetical protein C7H19_19815 [Aphanothece hegewaldii CCALA 016]